ncbi:MAG: hypothetical protein JNL42_16700 [Anaerolineae bacterium]|nr:hypothetical protein [Anaerolineae bacterium]
MTRSQLSQSRFFVGILLLLGAVLMFVFAQGTLTTAGAVAFALLGLVSVAISRRN